MIPSAFYYRPKISIFLNLMFLFLFLFSISLQINGMKVHASQQEPTISNREFINPNSNSNLNSSSSMAGFPQKKLRRLPHVFSQVLELPLRSNADVSIEDRTDCFKFVAKIEDKAAAVIGGGPVRAHAVKIHPGVTKVVVRGGIGGERVELLLDNLEVDVWRYRLPEIARPELATAVVVGGELVVTIPKGGRSSCGDGDGRDVWGGVMDRPVFVQ